MMKTLWEQDIDPDDLPSTITESNVLQTDTEERNELLGQLSNHQTDTVKQQVAWVLNQYPEARDSDVELQIRYWLTFERHKFNGNFLTLDDYRNMARLTTLVRTRQLIQNKYGLFKASPAVQKHRGTLQESEQEKFIADQAPLAPLIEVYIDESGKNEATLFVGSMWTREGFDLLQLAKSINSVVDNYKIKGELHFKFMKSEELPAYIKLVHVLIQNSSNLSFKLIYGAKTGISNAQEALQDMAYQLVSRGIDHEVSKGRLSLPIRINVWKDAEELGLDRLYLAKLRQTLETVGRTRFSGRLVIGELDAISSELNRFIQITDLFVASMRRAFSAHSRGEKLTSEGVNHKDKFTAVFLEALGINPDTLEMIREQDMVHLMPL